MHKHKQSNICEQCESLFRLLFKRRKKFVNFANISNEVCVCLVWLNYKHN